MELELNNIIGNIAKSDIAHNFISELQKYLENTIQNNSIERGKITMEKNKFTTEYRDKLLIERNSILNNYAKQTSNKGEMYYIYDKNSKQTDSYNLCICDEKESHNIIEAKKEILPADAEIGSVLRKIDGNFTLDKQATADIEIEINKKATELLEEQEKKIENNRIEGHEYEVSENNGESMWLFDITNNSDTGFEEINLPKDLLENCKEGDKLIYKKGRYVHS